jgi:hypothetical protein
VLKLSRKADECKPLLHGAVFCPRRNLHNASLSECDAASFSAAEVARGVPEEAFAAHLR